MRAGLRVAHAKPEVTLKPASPIGCTLAGCVLALLTTAAALDAQVPGGADSVKVRARADPATARPGAALAILVVLDHAAGFHTWPHEPVVPPEFEGLSPIATTIEAFALPKGAAVEGIRWPDPVTVTVYYIRDPVELPAYAGEAVVRLGLRTAADTPAGEQRVQLRVRYQACDERVCYPPKTVNLSVPFRLGPGETGPPEEG
jgi:DsbC/DsbD-like thiol-disulfide interchange protein